MKLRLLGLWLLLLGWGLAQAQDTPAPVSMPYRGLPAPAQYTLPDFDEAAARAAAKAEQGDTKVLRFGYQHQVAIDPFAMAEGWTWLPDSSARLWRLRLTSRNAVSLNLVLSRFALGPHSHIDFYTPGYELQLPRFTARDNNATQGIGTWLLPGEDMIVELVADPRDQGLNQVLISGVVHGWMNIFKATQGPTDGFNTSGTCNINVNCPQAAGVWQEAKRGVAMIIDGNAACTGSLINNTRRDGRPLFLTANHCFGSSLPRWVFGFNWESPSCSRGSSAPPLVNSISGASLLARNAGSDFMLLELAQRVPASFNPFFAGWDRTGVGPTNATCIHHPSGDVKKWSRTTNGATVSTWSSAQVWRVVWTQGTTEGGSSGSPLFNDSLQIIGQLYGGGASCSNTTASDNYGRLAVSWDGGGTATTRLKDHLDPLNLGRTTLPGLSGSCFGQQTLPFAETFDNLTQVPVTLVSRVDSGSLDPLACAQAPADGRVRADLLNLATLGTSRGLAVRSGQRQSSQVRQDFRTPALTFESYDTVTVSLRLAAIRQTNSTDSVVLGSCAPCNATVATQNWLANRLTYTPAADVAQQGLTDGMFQVISFSIPKATLGEVASFYLRNSGAGTWFWLDSIRIDGRYLGQPEFSMPEAVTVCEGSTVTLNLGNLRGADTLTWATPGATVTTGIGTSVTRTYLTAGTYNVTVTAANPRGRNSQTTALVTVRARTTATVPLLQPFTNAGALTTWQRTPVTGGWSLTNTGANGTTTSIRVNNFSGTTAGTRTAIFSPTVALNTLTNPLVRFYLAYAPYITAADSFAVGYSLDCGATYTLFWKRSGRDIQTANPTTAQFTPTSSQWQQYSLSLPAEIAQASQVQLAFVSISGEGNYQYLDEIEILSQTCAVPAYTLQPEDVCEGDNLTLNGPLVSGARYNWTGPNGWTATTQVPTITNITPAQGGTYNLSVEVNKCLGAPVSTTVTVRPRPARPTIVYVGNDSARAIYSGGSPAWYAVGSTTPFALTDKVKLPLNPATGLLQAELRVLSQNSCVSEADAIATVTTSARNRQVTDVRLYPNPAQGQVVLQGRMTAYQLLDLQGRPVLHGTATGEVTTLAVGHLPRGMYLMRVTTPVGMQTLRVALTE